MNNNLFNLINQLTQESKSLWRIKNEYKKDAKGKAHKEFWTRVAKEKEIMIKELQEMIKEELK
jgi:hypothetical protein